MKILEDAVPKGMRLYLPVERRGEKRGRHVRGRKGRKEARCEGGEGRKEGRKNKQIKTIKTNRGGELGVTLQFPL